MFDRVLGDLEVRGACLAHSLTGSLRWVNPGSARAVIVAVSARAFRRRNSSYRVAFHVD